MIFSWNEDLLHRVNQIGLTVLQQGFDLRSLKVWIPLFHLSQTFAVFLYNRAQNAKMDLLHYESTIGYAPVQKGQDVSCILREIYSHSPTHTCAMPSSTPSKLCTSWTLLSWLKLWLASITDYHSVHLFPEHLRSPKPFLSLDQNFL
jgi:hypothetical protein